MSAFESLRYFWPELTVIVFVLIVALVDLVLRGDPLRKRGILTALSVIGVLASGVATAASLGGEPAKLIFFGMTAVDGFAVFFKFLLAAGVLLVALIAYRSNEVASTEIGEFHTFLLAMLLGMYLLASSANLLMIYLALEFVSIVSYILTGSKRGNRFSSEAALKYVIYGAFASGIMLFGMSYLYGLFGSLDLSVLQTAIPERLAAASGQDLLLLNATLAVAAVFMFAGFGYKIAAVPFHMWCPDVYQGAPTPITALLSVAPKAAGFAVLIRFLFGTFTTSAAPFTLSVNIPWPWVLGLVSAVTMTLGNLTAINQTNLKRLLAYSSIAHAGYILMGVVAVSPEGMFAVLFYLVVYLFMNLGAFFVILSVRERTGSEEIDTYRGLVRREPFTAVLFAIFLFSLAGLPPLAGFIGKFYLFAAVIKMASYWYYVLAVIGILNSVISLYYYARIIKAMFLETGEDTSPVGILLFHKVMLFVLVVPTLVLGLFWEPVVRGVNRSLSLVGSVEKVATSEEEIPSPLAEVGVDPTDVTR